MIKAYNFFNKTKNNRKVLKTIIGYTLYTSKFNVRYILFNNPNTKYKIINKSDI